MNGLLLNFFWVATFSTHLSAPGLQASPVVGQEPIRCAPCSPERLAECPVLDAGCQEVLREPGCGCCLACALKRGDLCGIYTAPCGSGLRCLPRPGEARPLHALTRGQAACTETPDADQRQSDTTPGRPESNNGPTATNDGSSAVFVTGHAKIISTKESMKAKVNAMRKKLVEQGPCHNELQTALDKISKSQQKLGDKMTRFYLPNCDKRGHYKSKQCESSLDGQRGKCWCVSSWNGKRIPGSNDLPTDAECPEELNH